MSHGMFLPDGNTLIPTRIFNVLVKELRNEYWYARQFARFPNLDRDFRLQHARLATVCRQALRNLAKCGPQTLIA